MLSMTIEEVKVLIKSHDDKVCKSVANGEDHSVHGRIQAMIQQREYGKFNVLFCTPVGVINIRSSRKEHRDFASIDSAMSAVKECGHYTASVMCRGA